MCTLRYSATHKQDYNPIYRLGPVEAHQMRLVKSIEVASVVEDENLNAAFVRLVRTDQPNMRAQVRINTGAGSGGAQKLIWVRRGAALKLSPAAEAHGGYFSKNKATRNKPEKLKDTSGRTKADEHTYGLIMRDKERLLSSWW